MSRLHDDGQAAPIDRAALAVISDGDIATERRLLGVFRNPNAADAAALNAALERRDGPAVIHAAHRLLGASKMAGIVAQNRIQADKAAALEAISTATARAAI